MLRTMILPGSSGSINVDNVLIFSNDCDVLYPPIKTDRGMLWWRNNTGLELSIERIMDHWKKGRYHGIVAAEQGAALAYHLYTYGFLPDCMFMILISPDLIEYRVTQPIPCAIVVMLPEIGYEPGAFNIIRDTGATCIEYAGDVNSWTQRDFNAAFDCVQRYLMGR